MYHPRRGFPLHYMKVGAIENSRRNGHQGLVALDIAAGTVAIRASGLMQRRRQQTDPRDIQSCLTQTKQSARSEIKSLKA